MVFLKLSPYKNKSSVEMLYLCGTSKKSCFINFKSNEWWDGLKKYLMNLHEDLVIFLVVNIWCFYKMKLEIIMFSQSKMCFLVEKLSLWWNLKKKLNQKKLKTQCLHLKNHHYTFSTNTFINIAHKISLRGYINQFIHNLLTIIISQLIKRLRCHT